MRIARAGTVLAAIPAAFAILLAATADAGSRPRDTNAAAAAPADPGAVARRATIRSLRVRLSLDPKAAADIGRLADALRDADPQVRGEAVLALGKTGSRGLSHVTGALRDGDPAVRRKAIRALRWSGPGEQGVVSAVAGAVEDRDSDVRRDALQALQDFGDDAAPAIPVLRRALSNPDANCRNMAVDVLRRLGPEALPVLGEALSAGDKGVRGHSARILGELGDRSEGALPALKAMAENQREDPWVRHEATTAIGAIRLRSTGRRPSAEDIPRLLDSLKEPVWTKEDKASVPSALRSLGRPIVSDDARTALKAMSDEQLLARFEADKRRDRRERVAASIARVGPEAEAPLLAAVRSPEPEVRACALFALSKLGSTGPAALSTLREALRDPDPFVRAAAANALGAVREKAADRVPDLAAMLDDPDSGVRRGALEALGTVDPAGKRCVPAIVGALGDRDESVRRTAVAILSGLVSRSDEATREILRALPRDETRAHDASSRLALLEKLGPPAIPLLAGQFEKAPKSSTAAALGLFGPWAGAAVPALEKGLKSTDPELRRECVVALGRIGPGAKAAVPALVAVLKDPDFSVRHRVPGALVRIGPESPEVLGALTRIPKEYSGREDVVDALAAAGAPAVPHLAAALAERDPDLRARAARALAKIGVASRDAVPALLASVEDDDPNVGSSAVRALDEIGFVPRGALPRLIDIAKSRKDVYLRAWSVRAIGAVGPEGAAAAPALMEIIARKTDIPSTDDALYDASLEALARTAPGSARPVIAKALKSRDASWRAHAARILMELDPAAGEALARPVLLKALGERNERVRVAAALTLREHDPSSTAAVRTLAADIEAHGKGETIAAALEKAGSQAVPHLVRVFETGKPGGRKAAATCLGRLGPAAAEAVPALVAALEESDDVMAGVAVRTLGAIGPAAKAAVAALADLLRGRSGPLASYAAEALGEVGPDAAAAVPALRQALRGSNHITRDKAARALGKIGPAAPEAVPDLVAALGNGVAAPNGAVEALGLIGRREPRLVIPMLEKDGGQEPRRRVFSAAARLAADPGDAAAISDLENVMTDGPEPARHALHDLDPKALGPGQSGAFRRWLAHGDPAVRMQAASLLGRRGGEAKDAVAILAAGVKDPDPRVRESFLRTLREIGPEAKDAVPVLKEALGDWRSSIRWAAYDAIAEIDPKAAPPILRP